MSYILVSACLLGANVRYDGKVKDPVKRLCSLYDEGKVIVCCPEVDGGLPVPRPPAEIVGGDGYDVLEERSDILREDGTSVKAAFVAGAEHALSLCKDHDIKVAILKSKSPSCGSKEIYDGSFRGVLKEGVGVTTALLRRNGISVYDENEIDAAIAYFEML
jgi:uncharacterized protein YbbK (DUF523 family)